MPFLLWGRSAQLVENGVHKPGVPRLGGGKYRVGALSPSTIPTPSRQEFHTPGRLLAPGRKGARGVVADLELAVVIGSFEARTGRQGDLAAVLAKYVVLRSEEHTSELQSREKLVCRLLL